MLGAEAERLAVLLAVVEQISLIAFQHGPRDLDRFLSPALAAPARRSRYDAARLDRVLGVVVEHLAQRRWSSSSWPPAGVAGPMGFAVCARLLTRAITSPPRLTAALAFGGYDYDAIFYVPG